MCPDLRDECVVIKELISMYVSPNVRTIKAFTTFFLYLDIIKERILFG